MDHTHGRSTLRDTGWWKCRLFFAVATIAYANAQDISVCCSKAEGTCRNVCEKMAQVTNSDNDVKEGRIQNIYKFCAPQLTEFWICMNHTMEDVINEVGWWGRACCDLGNSPLCRQSCMTVDNEQALLLSGSCRLSDEIPFFDCVRSQQDAQWCCSQTHSASCHEACHKALWRAGAAPVEGAARERALDACDQSPVLLQCLRNMTASLVPVDTSKYLTCCHESSRPSCRGACEAVLKRTGELNDIADTLTAACGAPSLQEPLWRCFLRKDEPADTKDLIPYDVAKLHCCQKAQTSNCRKLCFETFNNGWQNNWQKFYNDCLGDPLESVLTECIEEVDSPCSLGCAGLTYCSLLNNRPTSLFRSCTARADLEAHLAVAEQKSSGYITVSNHRMPLKNSSQCPTDLWKSVACPLHVKPCTAKGHSSMLCAEDCRRLVSSCVEWSRAPAQLSAAALCARLTPRDPAAPCVHLGDYMIPSPDPPLLSAREAVTSPCSGAPCNASQVCVPNRSCLHGGDCKRYTCLEGCRLGDGSTYTVPLGSWVRVPMQSMSNKACFKLCRCGARGLGHCQPLPCVGLDNCRLHDKIVKHGEKYYVECNACACGWGERVCARRACGGDGGGWGGGGGGGGGWSGGGGGGWSGGGGGAARLPCYCPPHHLPVYARHHLYPNACLAKCAGATDAEIEFGEQRACAGGGVAGVAGGAGRCGRRAACLPAANVCLSRLQTSCPQHVCVNTSNCNAQPQQPVCDSDAVTHPNPCHLALSGKRIAYWGPCLQYCSSKGTVCGVNGVTYSSECAAWSEYVSVDYIGPCLAVGAISDTMEPKCQFDRIICPPLKKAGCQGITPPGACCPRCGGALRILYSKKQIDRALYGTNISATVINLHNVLRALDRHVKVAECALRGYLTIEMEIFVTVEYLLQNPTNLQLEVCVLEAEKLTDMINRESSLVSIDLGLSALSYALTVHTYPTKGATCLSISIVTLILSYISIYVLR